MKKFIKLAALAFTAVCTLAACGPTAPQGKTEWTEEESAIFAEHAYGWELPVPAVEGGTLKWEGVTTDEKGNPEDIYNRITFAGGTIADVAGYAAKFTAEEGWAAQQSAEGSYFFYGEKTLDEENDEWLQAGVMFAADENGNFVLQYYVEHSWELYDAESLMVTYLYWMFGIENAALDQHYRYDEADDMYWTAYVLNHEVNIDAVYDTVFEAYAELSAPIGSTDYALGGHSLMAPTYTQITTGDPAVACGVTFGTFTSMTVLEILCYIMEGEVIFQVAIYDIL